MTRSVRLESQASTRAVAGLLTVGLHAGLLVLVALAGGRRDGASDDDTPVLRVVYLDSQASSRRTGPEWAAWQPAAAMPVQAEPPEIGDLEPSRDESDAPPWAELEQPGEITLARIVEPPAPFVLPPAQATSLLQQVERAARELATSDRTQVRWQQDGRQYDAELVRAPASEDVEPDRLVVQVSAEDQGRQFRTHLRLKRRPFTYFAKFVDQWDPFVELHDDAVDGRTHINSRFNVLRDAQARPVFEGRVSTAAGGFQLRSLGRGREADVFREGVKTNAGRIVLSRQGRVLGQALRDRDARLHQLEDDTCITFFADGRYALQERRSGATVLVGPPGRQSVYLVAGRGATLHVQGVVAGRFLVYSPRKIVVTGQLVYARDPRVERGSDDYLGLVCDQDIEIAPPRVTGPGDLHIQAALFARRRLVVANFEHPRSATLHILGSVAAGSLEASEPRYATRIEYDARFEHLRPPGFPSTDQFEAEDWDGTWTPVSDPPATAAL